MRQAGRRPRVAAWASLRPGGRRRLRGQSRWRRCATGGTAAPRLGSRMSRQPPARVAPHRHAGTPRRRPFDASAHGRPWRRAKTTTAPRAPVPLAFRRYGQASDTRSFHTISFWYGSAARGRGPWVGSSSSRARSGRGGLRRWFCGQRARTYACAVMAVISSGMRVRPPAPPPVNGTGAVPRSGCGRKDAPAPGSGACGAGTIRADGR